MNRNDTFSRQHSVLNLIVYICGFLLFWEWLKPLESFTDTGSIQVFLLYSAFCFFLSYLQLAWWITSPLKLLGLLFVLDGLFIRESLLSLDWYKLFLMDAAYNMQAMLSQEWWNMTPLFRSFLFLLLLWLLSYLLHYWFIIAKRTLFFVVMTVIYVTVIDTFTAYVGNVSIMRVFLVSMILLGITHFQRITQEEKTENFEGKKALRWIFPLLVFIFSSSVIGYAAPKFNPQWPDPVPFLRSMAENAGGGAVQTVIRKVGYGENDEQLGGSFIQDDTLVFQAIVDEPQYWRIETKDFYTGKGWVRTVQEDFVESLNGQIDMNIFSDQVETEEKSATISFNRSQLLPKLIYPYGTERISSASETYYLSYSSATGEIFARSNDDNQLMRLNHYPIIFQEPNFTFKALRNIPDEDPEFIKQTYTQLPETVPARVMNLAEQIVKDEPTRYDQVRAVERFFRNPNFVYDTQGIPVPRDGQDYVDQFLFDTQRGYCDNFSTAMVVLLRSVDIPARWVKGFTSGDPIDGPGNLPDGMELYNITNANAHSWVEVYFPEIGWVPFEPTKGFSNMADFSTGLTLEELLAGDTPDLDRPEQEPLADAWNQTDVENQGAGSGQFNLFSNVSKTAWILIVAIVGLSGYFFYRYRFHWMTWWKRQQLQSKPDHLNYQNAYRFLLSLLEHKGMMKKPDQTLREFAFDVDHSLGTSEMKRLTYFYEQMIYRNQLNDEQKKKMKELWENLINRVLS